MEDVISIKGMLSECVDCKDIVVRDEIMGSRDAARSLGYELAKKLRRKLEPGNEGA